MSLEDMKARIRYAGGYVDNRLDKAKLHSMKSAMNNSYQAEWITFYDKKYRCLINPDKLKEDYDQKILSIEYNSGMKEGETFYWDRTQTHWLVFLQQHTESAYFRAQIRRCNYEVDVNDHKYWVYLRGPVETSLIWRQKHQIEFNELNYSLLMYITKNEETLAFFERFKVMKIDGHNWRVSAKDIYSQNGIIEVYLEEYFDNSMEDVMVDVTPTPPPIDEPYIAGPQVVEPWGTNIKYELEGLSDNITGEFVVSSSKVKIVEMTNSSCTIKILTGKAGDFKIIYRREGEEDIILPVHIESF
jgi:hypothetical protein